MKRSTAFISSAALAAFAAGCGASQPALTPATASAPAASWVDPRAATSDLLYVSDDAKNVYMYSYPAGTRVGAITGLLGPAGLCTDNAGHIFVTNTIGENIIEYERGHINAVTKLSDFGYNPDGCAFDPTTGNLAVANYGTPGGGPGSVAIYAKASGSPTIYQDANFGPYFFCTYDPKGNLYVDGVSVGSTKTEFAELKNGSSTFTDIAIDRAISYPGAVQWDGKYFAIEDIFRDVVYRLKIAGAKATVAQTVHFTRQRGKLLVQFEVANSTIFMPFGMIYRRIHDAGAWSYPGGGAPTKVIDIKGSTELYGIALSTAK